MRRAAVSIPSNIAEGKGRNTDREFVSYLFVACGSAYELSTQIQIARNLGYADEQQLLERCALVIKMLSSLLRTVRAKS